MVVGRVSGRVINVTAPVLLCGCHATVGRVRVRVCLRVRVRRCAIKLATPKSKGFEGFSKFKSSTSAYVSGHSSSPNFCRRHCRSSRELVPRVHAGNTSDHMNIDCPRHIRQCKFSGSWLCRRSCQTTSLALRVMAVRANELQEPRVHLRM